MTLSYCRLCNYRGEMVPHFPGDMIVRCPSCNLIFYSEDIDAASVYTGKYFFGEEYRDYLADKEILQKNFGFRLADIRRFVPQGKLLEIGCAFGFFLDLARRHYEVKGIDIAAEGVTYARETLGLNARCANFLELPEEAETYDVICLWDTIEHLKEPFQFLDKAARWLKPGGILALTTGDIASWVARFRGKRWRMIHPPTHLFYFSSHTLSRAAVRSGLRVVQISHVGYYRSVKSILYAIFCLKYRKLAWLYPYLGEKFNWKIYLNLHDIMMVVCRKEARQSERGKSL